MSSLVERLDVVCGDDAPSGNWAVAALVLVFLLSIVTVFVAHL